MTADNTELIAKARKIAGKGVAVDDGYTYSVHSGDLARYRNTINGLINALEIAECGRDAALDMLAIKATS